MDVPKIKWPESQTMIRHGQSAYNALRDAKASDPEYRDFLDAYETRFGSHGCEELARRIWKRYKLPTSDYDTPLDDVGFEQGYKTGAGLAEEDLFPPDIVLVSPHLRTRQTWQAMQDGGFKPEGARVIIEDRIREQEHGLSLLYSDWRVFHVLNQQQKMLRELMGSYWYQFPQGESVSMVRDRLRDVTGMVIREFAGLNVMMITHHLTILSIRANYERLSPEEFIHLDEHEKPVNCGVSRYICDPQQGDNGKMILDVYNKKYY